MPRFNPDKSRKVAKLDNLLRPFFFNKRKQAHQPIVKAQVQDIVLLCMYLIGDTIMILPVISVLKKNYPNAKITVVCGKVEEIVFKQQGLVDHYVLVKCPWISFDYSFKNLVRFVLALRTINRKKYDLAIDFRGDWRNIFYMRFIRSRRRISYNFTGGDYMLTDCIAPNPSIIHYIEESFYLLHQLGCEFTEEDKIPKLEPPTHANTIAKYFRNHARVEDKFVIGVHPGASLPVKKWDELKFAKLIVELARKYPQISFLLFEGPGEAQTVAVIEKILQNEGIPFKVARETLENYIKVLGTCRLVVCNDSGAAHIAGAYGIPTVVIFGSIDPALVYPYGSDLLKTISHSLPCKPCHQSTCRFGTTLCLSMVTVEEVFENVSELADALLPVERKILREGFTQRRRDSQRRQA